MSEKPTRQTSKTKQSIRQEMGGPGGGAGEGHSKSTLSAHPSYLSIEELPPTLEEGYQLRSTCDRNYEHGHDHQFCDEEPNHAANRRRRRRNTTVRWRPGVKEWLVLICVSIVVLMDEFDATVIIPLVPHLSHHFAKPLENILWLPTAYLLANASSQLVFTTLTDLFALGPLLVAALIFTTAGTGICGGSLAFPELLAGRIIQGIGGGGAMAISILIVIDNIPSPHWARYTNWLFTVRFVGAMLGPLLGGLFVDYEQFNWSFYFNFIFCALGLLIAPFALDLQAMKGVSPSGGLMKLDWLGCLLMVSGAGFLLAGLSWGGTEYAWDDWQTMMPIIIGGVLSIVLVVWETIFATRPLFTLRVLNSRSMLLAYFTSFLHGFVIFCQLQYLILYLTSAKYLTRAMAGVISLAITGQALFTIFLIGQTRLTKKIPPPWMIRTGWAITLLATGCFIMLNKRTSTPGVIFMFFAAGIGHGLLIPGYSTFFTNGKLQKQQEEAREVGGSISAMPIMMYPFLRTWGMCVAVPVVGTVLLSQLIRQMKKLGLDTSNEFLIRLNEVFLSEGSRDELEILDETGFRLVWQVVTGIAGLGGIVSLFIKRAV